MLSQPYSLTVFIHVPTFNQYVLNPLNHFKYKVRGVGTIFFWFFNGICASLMAMNEIQRNSSHREFLRWDIDKSCQGQRNWWDSGTIHSIFGRIRSKTCSIKRSYYPSRFLDLPRWDIDKSCRLKWTTMVVDMMGELRALAWPQFWKQGSIWGRFFSQKLFLEEYQLILNFQTGCQQLDIIL